MEGHYPELWKRTKPLLQTDFLVREPIPKWIGEVGGKSVLDAGCGEGYVSRMLAKLSAKVKAFDNDTEMISLALSIEDDSNQNIDYKVGDVLDVENLYDSQQFDIAILSGVPPFLDKDQLPEACRVLHNILKKDGILIMTTNHTRAYFEKAKSNWIEFLSEPDPDLPTQRFEINFFTPDRKKAFTGEAWIHTPQKLIDSVRVAGFKSEQVYEPLATGDMMKHFPDMWVDENRIPFHIAVIAQK